MLIYYYVNCALGQDICCYFTKKATIKAGADVNIKDNAGRTALDYAKDASESFSKDYSAILELLKKAEYDREGLKIDNTLAKTRKKVADKIGLGNISLPEWAKKAEAKVSKKIESMSNSEVKKDKSVAKTTLRKKNYSNSENSR